MKVAVTIPCYKVRNQILSAVENIGSEISKVYVVDDCCPQHSGKFVEENCHDPRVTVITHTRNQGVGGAVCTGYRAAVNDGMEIIIKIDGDGQMDTSLIPKFIQPIVEGKADYTKGSRFYSIHSLESMPGVRKLGNAVLSFVNKFSSGYWNIMDPTNGYTAIHHRAISMLPFEKINKRYFFESDMLFRLGTIRAVVRDIPMGAKYADEESSLSIGKVLLEFPPLYLKAFLKRVFYNYFLRDFNGASVELVAGTLLLLFGMIFGGVHWADSIITNNAATTGTVMISVLPIILGFQLVLSAITFDMNNVPKDTLSSMD